MIDGIADGYIFILGFLPVIVMAMFWFKFTEGLHRRLKGESNKTVKLEKTTQYASLPLLVIILVQIVSVGLLWVFGDVNLIPIVALNFLYFYLSMMSVRFVLTHLDTIELALLKYKKEDRENVYLNESSKLVYDKMYYINIVGSIVGVLIIATIGFLFDLNNAIEIFILLGYYILFGYMGIIFIPDYVKIKYIDEVKDTLLEDGVIEPSQHYNGKGLEDKESQENEETKNDNKEKSEETVEDKNTKEEDNETTEQKGKV